MCSLVGEDCVRYIMVNHPIECPSSRELAATVLACSTLMRSFSPPTLFTHAARWVLACSEQADGRSKVEPYVL